MRESVRLVKDGIPGGPPCISVSNDSNLKNEWDCYREWEQEKCQLNITARVKWWQNIALRTQQFTNLWWQFLYRWHQQRNDL